MWLLQERKAPATFGEEAGKEGARVELEHWPPRVKANSPG